MAKKAIYIDHQMHQTLAQWAKEHQMEQGRAAERMIHVAIGRLGALSKYNAEQKEKAAKAARSKGKGSRSRASAAA